MVGVRKITRLRQKILLQYKKSLNWLNSFISDPEGKRYFSKETYSEKLQKYKVRLKRVEKFLNFLGKPQDEFLSVHVAGTGGKGSTTMIIGRILETVFPKIGVHINPYLQIPLEKFLINHKMITPSQFIILVKELQRKYKNFKRQNPKLTLHYVELWVALYNLYFRQNKIDWAVIETGMGGRFDASNILNPELAVITNIDFDHLSELGGSLKNIAWHKAGIIKPGKPVITGEQKREALAVIRKEASLKKSKLYCLGKDFSWELVCLSHQGAVINVWAPYKRYKNIKIPLLGSFQASNGGLAIAAVDILAHDQHFVLNSEIINRSLGTIKFPGRMEIIQKNPLVILDGAHNPQKMFALSKAMKELYPKKKFVLICGMLETKNVSSALPPLLKQTSKIITVEPQVIGKPGIKASQLARVIKSLGYKGQIGVCASIIQAIKKSLNEADRKDIILITGSLYLLGEARNWWIKPEELLIKTEQENLKTNY